MHVCVITQYERACVDDLELDDTAIFKQTLSSHRDAPFVRQKCCRGAHQITASTLRAWAVNIVYRFTPDRTVHTHSDYKLGFIRQQWFLFMLTRPPPPSSQRHDIRPRAMHSDAAAMSLTLACAPPPPVIRHCGSQIGPPNPSIHPSIDPSIRNVSQVRDAEAVAAGVPNLMGPWEGAVALGDP